MDAIGSGERMSDYKPFDARNAEGIIKDLLARDKRSIAFELLEMYYKEASTLSDFDILGNLAQKAEHRDLYLKCAEAAYVKAETSEQAYIARSNLYKAYNAMNQPEKALFYVDLNLKMTPDDFETLTQKAFNIALMGDRVASEGILLELQHKHPEYASKMRSAFSGKMLREGKTAEGIIAFIDTFKPKNVLFDDVLKMKKWTGMPMPGKKIYIDGEGGIGDEIINIRFFKYLKDYGMQPILYSAWSKYREDIVDLFIRLGYEVTTDKITIDRSAVWAPMMSLPGYLNLTEDRLWYGTYMSPLNNPKNDLGPKTKRRIGIKCSGNPYFSQDEYRKIPIEQMLSYLPEDAEIFYIDKEKKQLPSNVIDLSDKISHWEDTLDYIEQMDCIVSSCTSLVHAAGAMGKKTHVIVPIAEYYIWSTTSKTTRSPWYGENFFVHKQTKVRSWHEPLQQMKDML